MKISSADFINSAVDERGWPKDGRPEVAFLGRSNVGKSSLINSLLQRKGLARTSNTPGRTQSINFFLINDSFYFVDLPGYGYAKVSKTMRAEWGQMAEEYLLRDEIMALCIQLIDVRHLPTALDMQLNQWLNFHRKPHVIVATKADKLSRPQLQKQLKAIEKALPASRIIAYSSEKGTGRDRVWSEIEQSVTASGL